MQRAVANKVRRAEDILRGTGGVVVAFSAGADSALVAALARRMFVTTSNSLPRR